MDVDKVVRDDVGETVEAIVVFEVVVVVLDPVIVVVPVDVFYIPLFSVSCTYYIYILLSLTIAQYSTNTLGTNKVFVNINR